MRFQKKQAKHAHVLNCAARDPDLSWKARGLLLYLLSLPDDWDFSEERVARDSNHDGKHATHTGIEELRQRGYLKKRPARNEKGAYDGWEWLVTDDPAMLEDVEDVRGGNNPTTGKPDDPIFRSSDNPSSGSSVIKEDTDSTNTELQDTKEKTPPAPPKGGSEKKKKKDSPEETNLPPNVPRDLWLEWCQYRREIGKTLKPTTIARQLPALERAGRKAPEMIKQSIRNGWTGLFEPESNATPTTRNTTTGTDALQQYREKGL